MADGWTVNLDQDCDNDVDYTATTGWGGFQFNDIPVSGQCHRITVTGEPGYQLTMQPGDFIPDTYTFITVGFYYPTFTISPSERELPSGRLGMEYNQTFSTSGGTGPYTYTITYGSLPAGFTLSADGILSGTTTEAGEYSFTVRVEDVNHAVGSKYYSLKIKADAVFTFTSSLNPSAPGEEVTFTVSSASEVATPYGTFPPLGSITFFVDGTPIEGCSDLLLNYGFDQVGYPIVGNFPATCTTAALETGAHAITATFTEWYGFYNEPSLSLTQVVRSAVSADLAIAKTASKVSAKPGSKMVYTLTASNRGPNPAESVTVTDKLDGNTAYVAVTAPSGWACSYIASSTSVTCSSTSLASGSSAIIKITVIVNKTARAGKYLVNNAFISSSTFDPDMSNNTVVQKTLVVK